MKDFQMKLAFAAVVLLTCSMLAGCGSSSLSNSSLAPPEWSKTAFAGASSELRMALRALKLEATALKMKYWATHRNPNRNCSTEQQNHQFD
jgi:hypothetical protein